MTSSPRAVYLLVTLDTKGAEAEFVRAALATAGVSVTLVDTGCLGQPAVSADVSRQDVFAAAGVKLDEVVARADRGPAITAAARGAAEIVRRAHAEGKLAGVLALGGSAGTTIGTAAMRALPLGVPKLMVSTLASGQVRHYVGDKDVLMLNSVVDILGVNRISRLILGEAAAAMAGMVRLAAPPSGGADKPLVAATMFGVTTSCVQRARQLLEEAGYEVLVFHATGNGGAAMESLIADGLFAGVLDITTTELADELVGGFLTAGPDRLTAAGRAGVPQVISVGACDMVNFHAPETVPERFYNRHFYRHNANVTLMRTTPEECRQLGQILAEKLNLSSGAVTVLLPLGGWSMIDAPGGPFWWPEADRALADALKSHLRPDIAVIEMDCNVNDPEFARCAAETLLASMAQARGR